MPGYRVLGRSIHTVPDAPPIHVSTSIDARPEESVPEADADRSAYPIAAVVPDEAVSESLPLLPVVVSAEGDPVPRLVSTAKSQGHQMIDLEFVWRQRRATPTAAVAVFCQQLGAERCGDSASRLVGRIGAEQPFPMELQTDWWA